MGRKPDLTFEKLPRVIGKSPNNPFIKEILEKQYHPYELSLNSSTGFLTLKVEENYYSSEELIAMLLQHVKEITTNFAGTSIKDCVLTIPSFFTQHEKEALYTAATIADLNVLSLIEENTAAALNYGMDRVFEIPTTVLYYNMGAGSIQVSIVTYSSYSAKEGGKNKSIGQFEVIGKGWDATHGGYNYDLAIAEHLADKFNEIWGKKNSGKGKDIRSFIRPMTRLRNEANKIKEVLSANAEYPYRIEQLHSDIDLVGKITRNDFENIIGKSLFDRLLQPIEMALTSANLTVNDIQLVELLGGSVRIPKVKRMLDEYFKSHNESIDVGQHLNGDEAMALGASFRAANISTQFRVRKVGMTDFIPFDIAIRVEESVTTSTPATAADTSVASTSTSTSTSSAHHPWHKHTVLFHAKSTFPTKNKLIAFNYDKDLLCRIQYEHKDQLPEGSHPLIAVYNITGITAFAEKHADKGIPPKVQLGFNIDNSGKVHLIKAEVLIEMPVNETTSASFETNSTDASSSTATDASAAANTTAEGGAAATSGNDTASAATKAPKVKVNIIRQSLTISEDETAVHPPRWTPAHIAEAKARLRELQAIDELRRAKAAALNDLEAFIYRTKNRLSDEEDKLKVVSTEEQRQEVIDLANAAEEWLYDDGRDQPVSVYQGKKNDIKSKAEAIFNRFSELKARTDAVTKVKMTLDDVKKAINSWNEKLPHITEEEKNDLMKLIEKADNWIEEKAEQQEKTSPFEKPIFTSTEAISQLKAIKTLYEKLLKKPKPAPIVVEKKEVRRISILFCFSFIIWFFLSFASFSFICLFLLLECNHF
jgi:hypoxia up-regulated 1